MHVCAAAQPVLELAGKAAQVAHAHIVQRDDELVVVRANHALGGRAEPPVWVLACNNEAQAVLERCERERYELPALGRESGCFYAGFARRAHERFHVLINKKSFMKFEVIFFYFDRETLWD